MWPATTNQEEMQDEPAEVLPQGWKMLEALDVVAGMMEFALKIDICVSDNSIQ